MKTDISCKIIVIEGPDKTGKETQSKILTGYLTEKGYKVTRVEVPHNDGFTYKIIYWMLRNGLAKWFPTLFQWIQYRNKLSFARNALRKLLWTNDYVIFDRWALSGVIYGKATNVGDSVLEQYDTLQRAAPISIQFVMYGPALTPRIDDLYEADNSLQTNVRKLYNRWALSNPDCVPLQCNRSISEVHNDIVRILEEKNII